MQESTYSPQVEISTGIAQVYKARYGRGPKRITAHVHADAVVCLLTGVNTPAMSALVSFGKIDAAQVVHAELQMGMAPEMSAVVERATGRTVIAYVPGFNARADATTDTFLLEALEAEPDGTRLRVQPSEVDAATDEDGDTDAGGPTSLLVTTPVDDPASTPSTPADDARVVAALERLGRALADTRSALHRLVEDVERQARPPEQSDT